MLSSYRTYEEWKRGFADWVREAPAWVLTVPMRNGNQSIVEEMETLLSGSYRTYEEWKRYDTGGKWNWDLSFLPYL